MKIGPQAVVELTYELRDEEGLLIDSSDEGPLTYTHGTGELVVGLERALEGKQPGDELSVQVSPEEAYGSHRSELVLEVQRSGFDRPDHLAVGMRIMVEGPQGVHVAQVTRIDGDDVTVDANHPLAGKTLFFDVQVRDVRVAEGF